MPADLRKGRRRIRFRSSFAMVLAIALVALVNLLGVRLYYHDAVAHHLQGTLDPDTCDLLRQLDGDLELIAYFNKSDPLARPVSHVLREFAETARDLPNLRLTIRDVDPEIDVVEATEIAQRHNAPHNSIIVRLRDSPSAHIIAYDDLFQLDPGRRKAGDTVNFVGEARVAAAIWSATRASHPVLYFLTGSGEYDPDDYDSQSGYSTVARELRQDLYDVRTLDLASEKDIPRGDSVLVIAGPQKILPVRTIELLGTYLASGGRLLLLLGNSPDPALAGLLQRWGVQLVPPPPPTAEKAPISIVSRTSPIIRALDNRRQNKRTPPTLGSSTARIAPLPESLSATSADQPRADILLAPAAPRGQQDAATNNVAVAVSIERKSRSEGARAHPTRIVVVGDSEFASNAMTDAGYDANLSFFLGCVHWLSERESLIGLPVVTYRVLRSGIADGQWPRTILLVVVIWPLALLLFGRIFFHRRS